MAKPKEIYRAGRAVIKKHLLPYRLPHMKDGREVDGMEMRAAGALDDGREFQDLRVFLREVEEGDNQSTTTTTKEDECPTPRSPKT